MTNLVWARQYNGFVSRPDVRQEIHRRWENIAFPKSELDGMMAAQEARALFADFYQESWQCNEDEATLVSILAAGKLRFVRKHRDALDALNAWLTFDKILSHCPVSTSNICASAVGTCIVLGLEEEGWAWHERGLRHGLPDAYPAEVRNNLQFVTEILGADVGANEPFLTLAKWLETNHPHLTFRRCSSD